MNNACQLLDLLNEFAAKEALTDTIILELTAINLPTFFVDNVSELQLSALNTIRTVTITCPFSSCLTSPSSYSRGFRSIEL